MFETIPKIRIFINSLLCLEILFGMAIIGVTCFYQRILSIFVAETERKMLTTNFFNIYILGVQLVASFLCGISLWARVWPRRYSENVHLLLSMWLIFCFLIVACGCAIIWSLMANRNTLSESAEVILLKGIDVYYMKPEWKLLWDQLQYTKECCGVHGYQDWMHATWMPDTGREHRDIHNCQPKELTTTECPPTYEDSDYDDLETLTLPPESHKILAPYACCKRNNTLCYEHYMPIRTQHGPSSSLAHLNLSDINTQGCFPLFKWHLTVVVHLIFILILFAVFVNFVICCLTKYVMATNYRRSYREFSNDSCMFDDEGNALVVIKCPPNVRCITLEEPNTYSGSDIPNLASSAVLCPCSSANHHSAAVEENHLGRAKHNHTPLLH